MQKSQRNEAHDMTINPRVIKRYQNRKLYDTTDSCYVTLEDIAELVKQGEDIQVIDNASKEDLTGVTLSQIIFEEEKRQKNVLPLSTLTAIIRSGGETLRDIASKALESGHRVLETGVREVENVREELSDTVEGLLQRGKITAEARDDLLGVMRKFVDSKVRPTVKNVTNIPIVQADIKELMQRIEELERRLQEHEKK
jgi:polyhydroxyalkanoate synthesis repressor PhaR